MGAADATPGTADADTSLDGAGSGVTLVQRVSNSLAMGTTLSVIFPAPPTSGHVLVLVGGTNIGQIASITGGSAAWTRAAFSTVYPNIEIWFGLTGASSTVTITATSLTGLTLSVSEWSGLATANTLDTATAMAGASSPASAGTIVTSFAPDLVIFGVADYTPNTFGTPNGGSWTTLDTAMSNSIQTVWYQVAPMAGTQGPQVSETLHMWDAAIAAFRTAP